MLRHKQSKKFIHFTNEERDNSPMTTKKRKAASKMNLKNSKSTKSFFALKKVSKNKKPLKRSKPIAREDIAGAQSRVMLFLHTYPKTSTASDSPKLPNLHDVGAMLGFSGSSSNIYQRVLRIIGPMRKKSLDWGRGRGKGIYLLNAKKRGLPSPLDGAVVLRSLVGKQNGGVLGDPHSEAIYMLRAQRAEASKHVDLLDQAIAVLGGG